MGIFIPLFPPGVDNLFCGGCKDEGKISTVLNSGDCLKKFSSLFKDFIHLVIFYSEYCSVR